MVERKERFRQYFEGHLLIFIFGVPSITFDQILYFYTSVFLSLSLRDCDLSSLEVLVILSLSLARSLTSLPFDVPISLLSNDFSSLREADIFVLSPLTE